MMVVLSAAYRVNDVLVAIDDPRARCYGLHAACSTFLAVPTSGDLSEEREIDVFEVRKACCPIGIGVILQEKVRSKKSNIVHPCASIGENMESSLPPVGNEETQPLPSPPRWTSRCVRQSNFEASPHIRQSYDDCNG